GMALVAGGSAMTFVLDRDLLARGVESGQITVVVVERELSREQMLAFTLDVVNWIGIGLLMTGIGLVLFAIAFVAGRRRARKRASEDELVDSYRSRAVYGAVTTAILSFL
ncbi:MAG: hypothetical protein ABEI52_01370, partial [Halobacteriaceae archaeon]